MVVLLAALGIAGYILSLGFVIPRLSDRRSLVPAAVMLLVLWGCALGFLGLLLTRADNPGTALYCAAALGACIFTAAGIFRLKDLRPNGAAFFLLTVWLLAVIYITLLNRSSGSVHSVQMTIGRFFTAWQAGSSPSTTITHALLNAALFVPAGLFFPALDRDRPGGLFSAAGFGLTVSVVIETLQLLLQRGKCDIDDIIMNTLGALIGYAVYRLMALLLRSAALSEGGPS